MERPDQSAMLHDIAFETRATSGYTGISHLSARVVEALESVNRADFVPEALRPYALANRPLPIDAGQTISQPFMVAIMTELLQPGPDDTMLEVGTGSGYQAAVLSRLVERLYTVEVIPALAESASARLARLGYRNVTCHCGDGAVGWSDHAPYDGIVVTAAAPEVPRPLLAQLKVGGRLVIPVGPPFHLQTLYIFERLPEGLFQSRELFGVAFVPLTGDHQGRRVTPSSGVG